jgi:magnesium-transporting ATPase (P-type)
MKSTIRKTFLRGDQKIDFLKHLVIIGSIVSIFKPTLEGGALIWLNFFYISFLFVSILYYLVVQDELNRGGPKNKVRLYVNGIAFVAAICFVFVIGLFLGVSLAQIYGNWTAGVTFIYYLLFTGLVYKALSF